MSSPIRKCELDSESEVQLPKTMGLDENIKPWDWVREKDSQGGFQLSRRQTLQTDPPPEDSGPGSRLGTWRLWGFKLKPFGFLLRLGCQLFGPRRLNDTR